jgi:rhodanese-related sulfurtransferase
MQENLDISVFTALAPFSSFGSTRLRELLEYCHLETFDQGSDPFIGHPLPGQSVYLVRGELEVVYADGSHVLIHADSERARHPIGKRQPDIQSATALTRIKLLRVADDLLDQMVTWDQFLYHADGKASAVKVGLSASLKTTLYSGMFSAENLSGSPFAHLPSANIGKLLAKIEAIEVWDKEVIIREGDAGDCYFLIGRGRAQATRLQDGNRLLTGLKAGDVFGEEVLLSDTKRTATVVMKSNGVLLRLKMHDFLELMQEPMLHRIPYRDAQQKVSEGAVWLDVRHPPEYRYDKLPNAINVPLKDVHNVLGTLSKEPHYVAYCQSGRRSAAAAFQLRQAGYKVDVLENGLWSIPVLQ